MDYCCELMKAKSTCSICTDKFGCTDVLIHHGSNSVGIIIKDGGSSWSRIQYCPWCGADVGKE